MVVAPILPNNMRTHVFSFVDSLFGGQTPAEDDALKATFEVLKGKRVTSGSFFTCSGMAEMMAQARANCEF